MSQHTKPVAKPIYEFGSYRLDSAERLLKRDGEVVPLQPKIFDLLLALVAQHGHLLEKDELMRVVWPDTIVEEANLANNISILRKTLGENGQPLITGKVAVKNTKIAEIGLSYMGGVYNKFQDDGLTLDKKRRSDVFAIDFNSTLPFLLKLS